MKNTKEEIKTRMLKNAATQWGVPANEIELSFDPVISMLLGACASELEKISEKINESQTRVTEKIIQLMTPETIFGPKPAHSIMYSFPVEDRITVTPEYLFSYKKNDIQKARKKFKEIFFSPIEDFNLVSGEVSYLAYGNQIVSTDQGKNKEVIFNHNIDFVESSTLYIGIKTALSSINLEGVPLYFESQDVEASKLFYHHLKNTKWYCNGKEIKIEQGFGEKSVSNHSSIESFLNEDSLKIANIIDEVKNNYYKQYVTLKENFIASKELPESFKDIVSANKVPIEEDTVWLKVVFPRVIDNKVIKSVFCSLNCFPVLNRKLESFSYQLKEYVDVIPVTTNNLFLDIKSIVNVEGQSYLVLTKNIQRNSKGVYSIKTDNIKKIDNRKAKEYIMHLIELLKDESASFSYLNNDFLQNNLTQLNQIISLLENKVLTSFKEQDIEVNYISVQPFKPKDNLLIEYWTTDGVLANGINYGSSLKNYKTVGLEQKSTLFMTSSFGGRDSLSMQERLSAYRRTLLSRDKVVTKEDIKLACFEFFGDKLKSVEVKNGYTVDFSLKKGMVNCVDVILEPNANSTITPVEWDFVENNLLLFLEKKSASMFPFVIKQKVESIDV